MATNARKRSRENETAEDGAVASAAAADAPARKRTKRPPRAMAPGKRKRRRKGRKRKRARVRPRAVSQAPCCSAGCVPGRPVPRVCRQQDMQNNPINTVEHHLFKAMIKVCLIRDVDSCGYSRCGRTDMGVSALGQVVGVWFRSSRRWRPSSAM